MNKIRYVFICVFILTFACLFAGCQKADQTHKAKENNTEENVSANVVNQGATDLPSGERSDADEKNAATYSGGEQKILVAYFSRADENYGVGYVEKGNTAIIAEMIAEETGGELFQIERITPYPSVYKECTDEAKQEQKNNARPKLMKDKEISGYDIIFLGYPIWWGDMPMPVYTFLEGHDFSDKTVIPFCTHAGSGLSGTVGNIKNICESAEILEGLSVTGEAAQNLRDEARESVRKWLSELSY